MIGRNSTDERPRQNHRRSEQHHRRACHARRMASCGGGFGIIDLVDHSYLRNSNRAKVGREMSQAIVMSFGEVILLGVVVTALLLAAFRK